MKGLDSWITRDERVEIPAEIYWVEDCEDAGSFKTYEEAMKYVLSFGYVEYPEDYIYSEQPKY